MTRRTPLWFALAISTLSACGYQVPPISPRDDTSFSRSQPIEPPGVDQDPPEPLKVMVGDTLRVVLQTVETQTLEGLVVDETGKVRVPLAGDVSVAGLTLTDASARIQAALRQFDRVITADVYIAEPNGHLATVLGAVRTPGRIEITPGTRLGDLVAQAGGLLTTETDAGDAIILADVGGARLVRANQAAPVSLWRAMEGDPRHNIRIRAGDHLYIPPLRGQRVIVLGQVGAPAVFVHYEGMRLTEALARAGGVTIDGDQGDIRIVRGDLRAPMVYESDLEDIADGDESDVYLAAGDIVYVTRHWLASVGELLDRLSPLLSAGTSVGLAVLAAEISNP
jgi:polysaccharide biosynthesis/export protein